MWIFHLVEVLLLGLTLHTEDPNGVSDTINIFLFPGLYLAARSEAAMVA